MDRSSGSFIEITYTIISVGKSLQIHSVPPVIGHVQNFLEFTTFLLPHYIDER